MVSAVVDRGNGGPEPIGYCPMHQQ